MASKRAMAIAHVLDREQAKLTRIGVREAEKIGLRATSKLTGAIRRGDDPVAALLAALVPMAELLTDGMVAADLAGRVMTVSRIKAHAEGRAVELAGVYDKAVNFGSKRLQLTIEALAALREQYGREAVEVMRNVEQTVERAVAQAVQRAIRAGEHITIGSKRLDDLLNNLGLRTLRDVDGHVLNRAHLVETIFRTQTQIAYAAGRSAMWADPAVQEILWGFEYVTVGDDRVRQEHELLDGMRLPKDNPTWRTHMPPNGYNCRCTVIEVFTDDPASMRQSTGAPAPVEVDGKVVVPGPDEGFGFSPGELFAGINAAL